MHARAGLDVMPTMKATRKTPRTAAELVTDLASTPAGDAALSATVLQAIGWQWEPFGCPGNGLWITPTGDIHIGSLPAVTETAETARTLLPEQLFVAASQTASGRWTVALFTHPLRTDVDYRDPIVSAHGHTLALALCSAAIQLSRI